MKQRHSFTNLLYHLVFHTKHREHYIITEEDEALLFGLIKAKAHELDAYVLEIGGWREHLHLLIRTRPSTALSEIYRQLKGFSSHAWRKKQPSKPFAWGDGVFAVTVDPQNSENLAAYIKNQHNHHEQETLITEWEAPNNTP